MMKMNTAKDSQTVLQCFSSCLTFFFCRPLDLSILVSFSTCAQEKVLRDHIR